MDTASATTENQVICLLQAETVARTALASLFYFAKEQNNQTDIDWLTKTLRKLAKLESDLIAKAEDWHTSIQLQNIMDEVRIAAESFIFRAESPSL